MIETANQPGVLAMIAERLAEVNVNIEYVYLAGGRGTEKGLIVLRPSDIEKRKARCRICKVRAVLLPARR